MQQHGMIRCILTTAILMALTSVVSAVDVESDSQSSPAPGKGVTPPKTSEEAVKSNTQSLEGIVVTGSANAGGVRKIDASYVITSANAEQIQEANAKSTPDLLKISPGLWPEATGGQTGANIEVAGFPGSDGGPYFTAMLNGSPLFGVPYLSFFETASLLRMDDTIERVEIAQGGPTVVLGSGQIGATANFILKTGTAEPTGSIGLTYGNEGLWRVDGFYGFKIADGWYGSVGGFWRTSDGVRDPQFKADLGGQLTATLTHDLDNGSITLYARRLDDKNQFVAPVPLTQTGPAQFTGYPGFDPLTGTYLSKAMQYVTVPTALGLQNANLGDGRGVQMNFFGGNFDYEINGWALSDKFIYNEGDYNTNALFSGTNPIPLSYYAYGCHVPNGVFCSPSGQPIDADNLGLAAGTPITANYTTGGAVNLNQSVIHQGWWDIQKYLKSFVNDLHVSKEIFDGNTATVGLYLTHIAENDNWSLGNQQLMSNTPNATPIVLSYVQNGHTYNVSNTQGFNDFNDNYNVAYNGTGNNKALYLSDSWRVDRWLFDAGVRVENTAQHLYLCNTSTKQLGTQYDLYELAVPFCNGTFTRTDYNKTHPSASIGANYEIADNQSAYVRATKGPHLGDFDESLRGYVTGASPPVQKVQSFEVGYKFQNDLIYADISAYHRQFSGLVYSETDIRGMPVLGADGQQIRSIYGSDSKGVNAQAVISPFENFKVAFTGNYQDGKYSHYNACQPYFDVNGNPQCAQINGVQLTRQPTSRFFVTPSYGIPTDWGKLTGFLTYTHVGNRSSDLAGEQLLGSYYTLDFGVIADVGSNWQFRVQGTNLTNQIGLTEGNARVIGQSTGSDSTVLARSIEGREVYIQAKYKF